MSRSRNASRQRRDFQRDPVPGPQGDLPHLPVLGVVHHVVDLEPVHAQQAAQQRLHLRLGELLPDAAPGAVEEGHVRVRGVRRGEAVPAVRIEFVGALAPEGREPVDGVGVDEDGGPGGDAVAAEVVVGRVLPQGEGDGGDVAEAFAADVVEVWEAVLVDVGQPGFLVAALRGEEEGHVLVDFLPEFVLRGRILGEEVQGPGDPARGGVVSSAQEGHHLISHRFEGHGARYFAICRGVVTHDECDDVLLAGKRLRQLFGLLVMDDFSRQVEDCAADGHQLVVRFHRQVLRQPGLRVKPVEQSSPTVEFEESLVRLSYCSLGVVQGVKIGSEPGLSNDVECCSTQPVKNLDGLGLPVFLPQFELPESGQQQRFAPEDWGERFYR